MIGKASSPVLRGDFFVEGFLLGPLLSEADSTALFMETFISSNSAALEVLLESGPSSCSDCLTDALSDKIALSLFWTCTFLSYWMFSYFWQLVVSMMGNS